MPLATPLTHAIGCELPIIQAPMAGANATPPELVAAVSAAGGLGFVGAAYMSPAEITAVCGRVRALTERPFGINLFAPTPPLMPAPVRPVTPTAALERVAPYHQELGLPAPTLPGPPTLAFADQLAAALESGATVFSFTFGRLSPDDVAAVKAHGMYLMGTATTVEEALILERDGVDAIVVQGSEAGGHRGTFTGDFEAAMIGTVALVPQVVDAVGVPVVASGGIMDGRGIAAALALGAAGVQLGTAFLTTEEAGVAEVHKAAILGAREDRTRVTRAFSGRPARGIVNRFMLEVEDPAAPPAILPYPLQNELTRPLRAAAAEQGRAEFLSLWAGQGVRLARREAAADLVTRLAADTEAQIRRLAALAGKAPVTPDT